MLPEEFRKRTNIQISDECYYAIIDGEYCKSNMDKDQWCAEWKRKGGANVVLQWEIDKRRNKEKEITALLQNNYALHQMIDKEQTRNRALIRKIEGVRAVINGIDADLL